ncbi:Por secretion system C-terminal sorting domain-containing protein [Arenibacter nanhaiticus]|uniref:Por secretion system C-terminal sorting domain-containing protein n=1 Tax=Arenibacter nanhaiticus TaxID=558155 RepID=A0A1M6I7I4_9FLAO|nr:T9SS type A sorting domain-containing protein [Arenibacter nanhaiticus]SHJ30333.1 Por secretion system C-terminal sorting domain-containing protein [Arenibacter nanhaiticus]
MTKFYTFLLLVFSLTAAAQEFPKTNSSTNVDSLKLYPNPAYDDTVHLTTKKNDAKAIVVYDIFGTEVLRDRITSTSLNISNLSPGVYILQVTENKIKMTRKLVVK